MRTKKGDIAGDNNDCDSIVGDNNDCDNIVGDNNDCDNDGDGNFDKDCDYTNRWRLNGRALIVIHTSDSGRCRTRCWVGHLF